MTPNGRRLLYDQCFVTKVTEGSMRLKYSSPKQFRANKLLSEMKAEFANFQLACGQPLRVEMMNGYAGNGQYWMEVAFDSPLEDAFFQMQPSDMADVIVSLERQGFATKANVQAVRKLLEPLRERVR